MLVLKYANGFARKGFCRVSLLGPRPVKSQRIEADQHFKPWFDVAVQSTAVLLKIDRWRMAIVVVVLCRTKHVQNKNLKNTRILHKACREV